jgi:cytoskeleton protein RodZ
MSSVGSYLRERREARGISLKEMARATRVREAYIEALEAGDAAELPAPVFARGFIRACCQVLNEPADEALRLYDEQVSLPAAVAEAPRFPSPSERDGRGRESILISLVLLIVLGAALFGLTLALQTRARPAAPAADRSRVVRPAVATEPDASARPAPADTPLPADSTPPPAVSPAPHPATPSSPGGPISAEPSVAAPPAVTVPASGSPYRLVARVKERVWVRVRTEDGRISEEMMAPGDVREWVSNRQFVLTIGNAGGLALELNGQALPPLGPSGVVIPQLVIPADQP